MKISRKLYSILSLIVSAIAGTGLAVAMSVMMLRFYDTDVHYFMHDTPWFGLTVSAVIVVAVSAAVLALTQKKDGLPTEHRIGLGVICTGVLAAAAMLHFGITDIRALLTTEMWTQSGGYISGSAVLFADRFNTVRTVTAVFAIVSAVYLALPAFTRGTKRPLRVIFGIGVEVFFIFRLLVLYYDVTTPLNSPVRMFDQMATVAAMLCFIPEMRFLLSDARPRLYVPLASLAFVMLFSHSVSQTVALFSLDGMVGSLGVCIFEFFLAIYIFANLVSYLAACTKYEPGENTVEIQETEQP